MQTCPLDHPGSQTRPASSSRSKAASSVQSRKNSQWQLRCMAGVCRTPRPKLKDDGLAPASRASSMAYSLDHRLICPPDYGCTIALTIRCCQAREDRAQLFPACESWRLGRSSFRIWLFGDSSGKALATAQAHRRSTLTALPGGSDADSDGNRAHRRLCCGGLVHYRGLLESRSVWSDQILRHRGRGCRDDPYDHLAQQYDRRAFG